jgi:hypothetical protein
MDRVYGSHLARMIIAKLPTCLWFWSISVYNAQYFEKNSRDKV